jgi:ABC-type branched-subunit amino acid transport system substrate-binding protein
VACVCAASAVLAAGAQARTDAGAARAAEPGLTGTTITIGGTVPLSGVASPYASVGYGASAYFSYVNARGGVNGRKITYKYVDDVYNPANTVQEIRKLVQEDQVFAIFNSLGTEHNLAVRPFLNQVKVPQLFVASGASTFGNDYKRYPFTTPGFIPNYVAEGRIYGRAIGLTRARATVAVLYQNDDYGKEVLTGLKQGLRFYGRGGRVVADESYELTDPDVGSQVAKLASSKANFFLVVATPRPTIQAFIAVNKLGWRPRMIVNAVSSASNTMKISAASSGKVAEGAISLVFLKDPNDPAWKNDPGMKLYRSIMKKYGKGDVTDVYNVYAMAVAHSFVTALRKAGRNVTRASLVKAVTSLTDRSNPFVLPGVQVRTLSNDRFAIKQAKMQRWTKGRWVSFGPLLNARGTASS